MTYNTPTLTLVGATQNLVLGLSFIAPKPNPSQACTELDAGGGHYLTDESGW